MPVYRDGIGREVRINHAPKRIISLVPSISELLVDLDIMPLGRTRFCIHPKSLNKVPIIGGTKNIHVEKVRGLNPDLIVANKEENPKPIVETLSEEYPVWVTEVKTLEGCLDMIQNLGKITEKKDRADELESKIHKGFVEIAKETEKMRPLKALYLIWKKPYMAAGTDSFISDIMERVGLSNCLESWGKRGERYPKIDHDELKSLNPDVILLSSEPYPFKEADTKEIEDSFGFKSVLVDGACFSWYGSRMAKSINYLTNFSRSVHKIAGFP